MVQSFLFLSWFSPSTIAGSGHRCCSSAFLHFSKLALIGDSFPVYPLMINECSVGWLFSRILVKTDFCRSFFFIQPQVDHTAAVYANLSWHFLISETFLR